MAEVVEYNIEKTISELEQLERYGLLTDIEIKAIIKKRKAFEYRLQRNTKIKEDYLKYIAYEQSLMKLIHLRRDKSGIKYKTAHIEHMISLHIMSLYRKVVFRNQFDVQMWLTFIDFCRNNKSLAKVSSIYTRMLSVHSNKDWLWIRAAKFEFEDNNSPETARNLLQRGIRFNSDSRLLWHQYFKLELMFCTKIRKRREVLELNVPTISENNSKEQIDNEEQVVDNMKDEVYNGVIACIVYKNAVLTFDDFEFAAHFLPICSQFDHRLTERHKDMIYEDLKLRFASLEKTWDLMAKRIIEDGNAMIQLDDTLTEAEEQLKKKEFERQVIGLFETKINEFKSENIWTHYIEYRLQQLSKCKEETKKREILLKGLDVIERAWNQNCLSTQMFKEWIKLYFSTEDKYDNCMKISQIIVKGCERWSDNMDIWHFCIPYVMKIDSKSEIKCFFEKILHKFGYKEISDESITIVFDIWEQYIKWSTVYLKPIEVMNITKKLSKLSSGKTSKQINEYMKPKILDALNSVYGLEKTRHYYHSYKKFPPNLLSFHRKMLEIEKQNANPNYHLIHGIHEEIVNNFGSNDATLWIDYVMFEMKYNANKVADIYYKAVKQLTPEESDKFIQNYSILKSNNFHLDLNIE
ncbi:U3 small nucleolar RNA-associated protein 6 homolog [Oppia nitens]|uniref:U3 small nucleolar RNA-associated protein 6 homolog n=1 Tax=Oppia nitens TaxID=1686743 RepID=UPI0023DB21BF|nr:U3 small nucleolar RNA-associated protein 6 homolog [Oppia nitens]